MKTLLLLWKALDNSLQGVRNKFYDEIAFHIELAVCSYFNSCCTAIAFFTDCSYFADFIRPSCIVHRTV